VTPFDLLAGGPNGSYPDRTRPFVTHYAGPTARVELSVASVGNAVAKASGMLRDGLGVEPGASVVSIDLPLHWQLSVWTLAALSVGARCGRRIAGPVDIRIIGPDGLAVLAQGADPAADEVLVCSCDAFGMPFPGGLPASLLDRLGSAVRDIATEVRSYPDSFVPEPAASGAEVLLPGEAMPWQQAAGRAASLRGSAGRGAATAPARGARFWVDESVPDADLLLAAALVPLWVGGSVVLASDLSPMDSARIRGAEGVPAEGRGGEGRSVAGFPPEGTR
jgi:uncharacterized protein (TIGR03089 family)